MLPLILGGAGVLLLLAAGGGAGGTTPTGSAGSGRVVRGPPPHGTQLVAVSRPPDPLLDAARKARAYVTTHKDLAPELAQLAQLARSKGRADVANILGSKS